MYKYSADLTEFAEAPGPDFVKSNLLITTASFNSFLYKWREK